MAEDNSLTEIAGRCKNCDTTLIRIKGSNTLYHEDGVQALTCIEARLK